MMTSSVPLRVGIDARGLQKGTTGLGNYLASLLEPMARKHPDTQFFLYSNLDVYGPAAPNIHVRQAPRMYPSPYWMNIYLPRRLRAERIDVFWGAIGYVPVGYSPCPSVLTLHDFSYHFAGRSMRRPTRWNRAIFQRLAGWRARRLVAVSQATAEDTKALYSRTVDAVVHPIVAPSFSPRAMLQTEATCAKYSLVTPYLLCVATLEPRKNLLAMVLAYLNVVREGAALPQLVLVGASGWLSAGLRELIDEAERRGELKRMGFVEAQDLPSLYAGATVSLLPSTYEGFGMPLPEAQLCGVPVMHGAHASMVEAAGGLGVVVEASQASWACAFVGLARGELPLTCRLPHDIPNDADVAAERMWQVLVSAAA